MRQNHVLEVLRSNQAPQRVKGKEKKGAIARDEEWRPGLVAGLIAVGKGTMKMGERVDDEQKDEGL